MSVGEVLILLVAAFALSAGNLPAFIISDQPGARTPVPANAVWPSYVPLAAKPRTDPWWSTEIAVGKDSGSRRRSHLESHKAQHCPDFT